jgi:hypothetical protein
VQPIPLTYFELEHNLGMFGNLLGMVLGINHVLTMAYRTMSNTLAQGYHLEIQQIIDNKRYIKPAHILCSIKLMYFNWFFQKKARVNPPQPDFAMMWQHIMLNTYILPHLPPALYKLAYPKLQPYLSMRPLTGSSVSSSRGTSVNGSSASGSTISGLTIPTTTTGLTTHPQGTHHADITPDH